MAKTVRIHRRTAATGGSLDARLRSDLLPRVLTIQGMAQQAARSAEKGTVVEPRRGHACPNLIKWMIVRYKPPEA